MPLAEGVQGRVTYKAYSTGAITPNAQPVPATDPGATGGQILRRTASSLALAKDTYQSNEIRSDRQIADYRHGARKVTGSLSGEFSPKTYFDLFEAACRGTRSAAINLTEALLTSVAADAATSKFTFGGGNPVTSGLRVGQVIRFTNLATAGNNARNFAITGFGGTNNRDVSVYPPPITMAADTAFGVATAGAGIIVPSTGFVSRKFAIEVFNQDIDVARFFKECRNAGFTITLPGTGNATVEFPFLGRDMDVLTGAAAPFFTGPAAETTTGVLAAVNGLLRVGGSVVGVITGATVQMDLNASSEPVLGQNFAPEIFLGRANVTGQLTAMLQDEILLNSFVNETEIDALFYLTASSADAADAVSIYLPRIKLGGGAVADQGEGGQTLTLPFQALKYVGSAPGVEATTIQIHDTAAS